ncbi:MAG: hypothetical protein KTV77_03135 [Wolbachia endosymbiont of Fragariocoptes setiger]|nr:hypothetical protein [Wolbachia endosymbiont of Fragariocoptes setiger]
MLPISISILVSGVNFITRASIVAWATTPNSKDKAPIAAGEVKPRATRPIPIPNSGQESIINSGTFFIESPRLGFEIRDSKKPTTKSGKPEPIIPPITKGDRLAI